MNAKYEFLEETLNKTIKCAAIGYGGEYNDSGVRNFSLKVNYTEYDFQLFLSNLDFNYDNGYGGQELFGFIWYMDGTWSERFEYDGAEDWAYKSTPEIPEDLLLKETTQQL